MNFELMDTETLVDLWQVSGSNPAIRVLLESELKKRVSQNKNFPKEYFFEICKIKNHALTVSFIPGSSAFQTYGSNLTIDIILEQEELNEMLQNYSANPKIFTFGLIKANVLVKDKLTPEQIARAKDFGFHTQDVFETLHV